MAMNLATLLKPFHCKQKGDNEQLIHGRDGQTVQGRVSGGGGRNLCAGNAQGGEWDQGVDKPGHCQVQALPGDETGWQGVQGVVADGGGAGGQV